MQGLFVRHQIRHQVSSLPPSPTQPARGTSGKCSYIWSTRRSRHTVGAENEMHGTSGRCCKHRRSARQKPQETDKPRELISRCVSQYDVGFFWCCSGCRISVQSWVEVRKTAGERTTILAEGCKCMLPCCRLATGSRSRLPWAQAHGPPIGGIQCRRSKWPSEMEVWRRMRQVDPKDRSSEGKSTWVEVQAAIRRKVMYLGI